MGLEQHVPLPIRRLARRAVGGPRTRRRPVRAESFAGGAAALDAVIAYNAHGGYCVPLESVARPSAQCILRGDVWEPGTLELLRAHVGDGDVVHAGTYFGDFLPLLSRAVAPGARIWAFEPSATNFACARITTLLNGLENVELTNAGLSAASRAATLHVADADGTRLGGGSRIVEPAGHSAGDVEEIRLVTVDEVVPDSRAVSIVQLDVEGHEQDAIEGALGTIRRCRPLIVMERRPRPAWFEATLAPLGYRVGERVHHNTVLRPDGR